MPYLGSSLLEKRGAQPYDTVEASLRAVAACDIYIGIFGEQYSETTIKEYKKAHASFKPIFIYIKKVDKREPKLQHFIETEIDSNYKREKFNDREDLCSKVKHDLEAYIFSAINDGIASQKERKKNAKEEEKKKKVLLSLKKGYNKQFGKLLANAQKQLSQGMLMEAIISSAFIIELALRQKLSASFPKVDQEPIGQIIQYARTAKIVPEKMLDDIRNVQYIRNEVTHRGTLPSVSIAKFAFNAAKRVVKTVTKASIGSTKWVASYSVNVSDIIDDEDFELPENISREWHDVSGWLRDELIGYFASKGLQYDIEEEDSNGETFSIRISFDWNPSMSKLPIGNADPWELLELEPYVKIYGEEPDD